MHFFVVVVVILFFGRMARHVESWFPNQGSTCTLCIGRSVFLSTDPSLPPTPTLGTFLSVFFFNNILKDFFF